MSQRCSPAQYRCIGIDDDSVFDCRVTLLTTDDGVSIYYEHHEAEGPPRPTVIFSCAYCTTHENWRGQVDPIVAAAARATNDGTRVALCGIARTPELVDVDNLDRLEPPGDFRGSSEYRRHLAIVLSTRVIEELS